ncbi:MAG TPA: MFS transporter [Gaiellaceae bacterium]|nr:MFS transporter [Gaiellaceae bacterium]
MVARRQTDLLRSAREFRLLFLAAVGSGIGTRLAVLALMVDVWDRTHSGKWVAALLVTDFVPIILIGVLLGSFLDRFSRRKLMIASDVLRAAVFCALPFANSAVMVVALAGVVGLATGFFRPASYAGLPNLVPDDELADANGLFQAAENLTWMLGPLLGGVLLSYTSPDGAYWFNAATFVVSALLIARIAESRLQSEKAESEGHLRDVRAGFALLGSSRALLAVVVAWSLASLAVGISDVAEVELAKVAFDSGNFGLGLLMAASGLGLIFGSLWAGWATERFGTATAYGAAIATMGAGIGLAAVSPTVWIASAIVVAVGIGNGVAAVANSLLVQRGTPDTLRGRAFTVAMSVNYSALLIGMMAGGFVSDAVGARWSWGIAGILTGVAALAGAALLRGVRIDSEPEPEPAPPVPVVSGAAPSPSPLRD